MSSSRPMRGEFVTRKRAIANGEAQLPLELRNPAQKLEKLAMHDLVAAADRAGLDKVSLSVRVGDETSGFTNEKRAGSNIPRVQAALPEGVEPPGGDIRQIERRAAHPSHIHDSCHHSRQFRLEPRMLRRLAEVGNAAAEDGLRQVGARRDSEPPIVADTLPDPSRSRTSRRRLDCRSRPRQFGRRAPARSKSQITEWRAGNWWSRRADRYARCGSCLFPPAVRSPRGRNHSLDAPLRARHRGSFPHACLQD